MYHTEPICFYVLFRFKNFFSHLIIMCIQLYTITYEANKMSKFPVVHNVLMCMLLENIYPYHFHNNCL